MAAIAERVAVVGMAGRYPGCGADLDLFWHNVATGVDCSRPVPDGRWLLDPADCVDPRPAHPDSVYSARGYFLDPFQPDLDGLEVPADFVGELDTLFQLVLDVGGRAWRSAQTGAVDRRRAGVVFGNICLPTDKASDLAREYLGRGVRPRRDASRGRSPAAIALPSPRRTHPLNRYPAGLPAGLLGRALGLGGGTYTLDGACASSLYALKLACDELLAGRADLMLAGGACRPDCLYTQMGFSQLRALSARGECSPFDAAADGLVVGEGAGLFVLKRLSDALKHNDTIHGVICGVGLSNDLHGNLLAPAKEGQLRAMRAAYDQAGWKPHFVDAIDCHATGTPVGDSVEFDSLRELWGSDGWKPGQCAIGSVKSTVGHLLTGAGAVGLTKMLLGMAKGQKPPQANFAVPNPNLAYDGGPFVVRREPEFWDPRRPTSPRRAAVSGFGFGGVNAHLLVENYVGQTYTTPGGSALLRPGQTPVIPPAPPRLVTQAPASRLIHKLNALMAKHGDAPAPAAAAVQTGTPAAPEPIAVVGVGVHVGPWAGREAFQARIFGGAAATPSPKRGGWHLTEAAGPPAYGIDAVNVSLERFRIPPKELTEMLPQQLVMLTVAAEALDDVKSDAPAEDVRAGVFVGLNLDLNTTNFHLRWHARSQKADPNAVGPPLTADRTMGALGSVAASRIARAFHFGGPSFTVSSEETSAGRAILLAVQALRNHDLDRAVAGGVELGCDPRAILAADAQRPFSPDGSAAPLGQASGGGTPGEGAAAVVLKRLSDAERDGDRVYAVIRGVGAASGGAAQGLAPDGAAYASSLMRACTDGLIDPTGVAYLEAAGTGSPVDDRPEAEALGALLAAKPRPLPVTLAASRGQVGNSGAAGCAVGLVKAVLALYQQVLPPTLDPAGLRPELQPVAGRLDPAGGARFWLKNQNDPPRRALVAGVGVDGSAVHVLLEEYAGAVPASAEAERAQPLGAHPEAAFALEADTPAELLALGQQLHNIAAAAGDTPVERLAGDWLARVPPRPQAKRAVALVARTPAELAEQWRGVQAHLESRPDAPWEPRPALRDRVFYSPAPLGPKGKVALVFPGSGNHFAGMGRDLGARFPAALRRQQAENARLRDQYAPAVFWGDALPADATPAQFLFGQVTLGTLVADTLVNLGVPADAMVGQSLGESAGLFGLRVWAGRDEMLARIEASSLFQTDLAPPYRAAQRFWGVPPGEAIDWAAGVLTLPADDVRAALRPGLRAYLLIVTTPTECVVGGVRADVEKLAARFPAASFFPLEGVTIAHCEVARPVEQAYRELHTLPTASVAGLTVYSGVYGRAYKPMPASAADSITAGLLNTIDFPAAVRAAYRDGVRTFLEVGPGQSATRMVAATLAGEPHVARAVCVARQDAASLVLRTLAHLVAERRGVTLAKLYAPTPTVAKPAGRLLTLPVGMVAPGTTGLAPTPAIPVPAARIEPTPAPEPVRELAAAAFTVPAPVAAPLALAEVPDVPDEFDSEPWLAPQTDLPPPTPKPDPAPMAAATPLPELPPRLPPEPAAPPSAFLSRLLGYDDSDDGPAEAPPAADAPTTTPPPANGEVPRALDRAACLTFARGKIGDVLGSSFAAADAFPTRVRLPDGPLMLVDAIRSIEGEPLSMGAGRVVTEHAVHAGRWYLDAGRCPVSVTVESGQADLFLAGFLGIDFQTRGLAVYRLLDAVVTFHRGLPKVGETVVYDIHVDEFFRQADSWLFRFRFEGSVNGEPLLSMKHGVAGFFTEAALAAGQGVVHTRLDRQPMPAKRPADWRELVPFAPTSLDAQQVRSLYRGDLATAFGPDFAGLPIPEVQTLPSGMLRLLDRVPLLDIAGGRYGLGFVRGEYDIQPEEWFIECHFIDDKVMPGTLMYECCLHTLRVLMMRRGWVGGVDTVCEPVPGVGSRLKCRGQVLQSTGTVTYEVSVKEVGFAPMPYCVADALMFADGKPIVEITNLSLRMSGLDPAQLKGMWAKLGAPPRKPALYDKGKILAYSNGNPSEAFGEPYKVFDAERVLARLPGEPFQFLDRITAVVGEPFVLKDGASCEAEYEVPPGAWYFAENRCELMPFSVLLEIALQPCGWLAAYCGSALTSPTDLSFRNLGGQATQFRAVTPESGLLTTNVTMTRVSKSAGMVIQHFTMQVRDRAGVVYEGTTYFGFFAAAALTNQVGMPAAKVPQLTPAQLADPALWRGQLPTDAPFPAPQLRMVDGIAYHPAGGRVGLGLVQGEIAVDPGFWFFEAHFYQDPVWPGSLGLESFLQLLKFAAWQRFGPPLASGYQTVALNAAHEWVYRGQVLPGDKLVTVSLEVTAADDAARRLTADGFLSVDGRIIYQMKGFTLE